MADIVRMLHDERISLQKKLSAVERAIEALSEDVVKTVKRTRKKMSAAARKKISMAQKARWAKAKKAKAT